MIKRTLGILFLFFSFQSFAAGPCASAILADYGNCPDPEHAYQQAQKHGEAHAARSARKSIRLRKKSLNGTTPSSDYIRRATPGFSKNDVDSVQEYDGDSADAEYFETESSN